MRLVSLIIIFFVISCADTLTTASSYYNIEHRRDEIWICHNVDSEFHQERCSEECYDPGNQSAFCWLLEKEQCYQPDPYYIKFCDKMKENK